MLNNVHLAPDVAAALKNKQPIVALESTIITHGLPYPENLEMAQKVESIVRQEGAIPATVACIDGQVHVGLEPSTLHTLATSSDCMKLSKRDIGFAISQRKTGGTTVSGTLVIAHAVGIRVFATGGIGGVHRGAQHSFDVSRDLEELATCDVAVVCAGAKAILDLEKTMEVLETKGVDVIGYQTDWLPAFYYPNSGVPVPHRVDTPDAVASLMEAKWSRRISGGVLVANPIPDAAALDRSTTEAWIQTAIENMNKARVSGKDQTPYLLDQMRVLSDGKTVEANLALVYHNALVAARIAKAYHQA